MLSSSTADRADLLHGPMSRCWGAAADPSRRATSRPAVRLPPLPVDCDGASTMVDPASGGVDGLGRPVDGLTRPIHFFVFYFINPGGHQSVSEEVTLTMTFDMRQLAKTPRLSYFCLPPLIFW